MRTDSMRSTSYLHWHDGSTCHGAPTLEECAREACDRHWSGRILRRVDRYEEGGPQVECFTLITAGFDHWARYGNYVALVETTWRKL